MRRFARACVSTLMLPKIEESARALVSMMSIEDSPRFLKPKP